MALLEFEEFCCSECGRSVVRVVGEALSGQGPMCMLCLCEPGWFRDERLVAALGVEVSPPEHERA